MGNPATTDGVMQRSGYVRLTDDLGESLRAPFARQHQIGHGQIVAKWGKWKMAEREGFEPSVHLLGVHTISSRAPSASRASLRQKYSFMSCCLSSRLLLMAERVGFEPTCPALHRTSRFRVDPVTASSVPLHDFSAPGVALEKTSSKARKKTRPEHHRLLQYND
jgi:hypothetical protein